MGIVKYSVPTMKWGFHGHVLCITSCAWVMLLQIFLSVVHAAHDECSDIACLLTPYQEYFVEHFAKEAFKKTTQGKRKTIQKRDLGNFDTERMNMNWMCSFLLFCFFSCRKEACLLCCAEEDTSETSNIARNAILCVHASFPAWINPGFWGWAYPPLPCRPKVWAGAGLGFRFRPRWGAGRPVPRNLDWSPCAWV